VTPVQPKIAGAVSILYAKDQPEYRPLPAVLMTDEPQMVVTEWVPSTDELVALINGGRLRINVLTFGKPLQPFLVEVTK
jgi:hypothetical protein